MHRFNLLLIRLLVLALGLASLLGADDALAGKWAFALDTPGGQRTQVATFTLDGDNVGGKWDKSDVKGTFKDGQLELKFPLESAEAGSTGTFAVTGKLADGKLTGRWSWESYGGTFSAVRKLD
ncbi:MAG: hypothetical protein NTZ56_08480 [Acidobacteria bacterium]|nr:hypothetical protein [Acidobacteriota bacterium]